MKTHRIIFEKYVSGQIDNEGVEKSEWIEDRKAWARIENRHGSQKWQTGGYAETVTNLFTINYIPGWMPTTAHRLIHDEEIYDIESVENVRYENRDVEIRATRTGRTLAT